MQLYVLCTVVDVIIFTITDEHENEFSMILNVSLLHFYLKCTYSRFNFAYDTHNCYVSQYIAIVLVRSIHGIQHFFFFRKITFICIHSCEMM